MASSSSWAEESEKEGEEGSGFGNANANAVKRPAFESKGSGGGDYRRSAWGSCALVWLGCAIGLTATGWAYAK